MGKQSTTPGGAPGAGGTATKGNQVIHQKGGKVNPDDRKQAAQDAFARDPGPLLHALRLTIDDHQSKPPQVYFVFDGPEKNASLQVGGKPSYAGRWTRYGTDKGGDAFDLVCHVRGWNVRADFVRALEVVENAYGITPTTPPAPASSSSAAPPPVAKRPPAPLSPDALAKFVDALTARPELVSWLNTRRGFSPGVVAAARIGLDAKAGRFVLPVLDAEGNCRDLRRWRIPEAVCDEFGLTPSSSNATWLPLRPGDGSGAPRLYDPFSCVTEGGDRPLFLAEGEWDCLRLADAGAAAFTITDGAAKWPDGRHDNPPPDLTGRVVYLVGDHDPAGQRHNEQGAVNCYLAGAAQVFAVKWPAGFGEKGDASDFLNAGGTVADLQALAVEVPKPRAAVPYRIFWTGTDLAAAVFPDPVWVVPGVLPEGTTLLAGRPKLGKSWLALQLAFAKAVGGVTLGEQVEPGRVLYCALEDNARRIQDRTEGQHWTAEALAAVDFILETDLDDLEAKLSSGNYSFAVVDTFAKLVMASGMDQNSGDDMTAAWGRLHALSLRTNCSLLVLEHHRKSYVGDAVQDIAGSTAKAAVVDCVAGLYRERGQTKATLAVVGRDVEEHEVELRFEPRDLAWYPVDEYTGGIAYKHDADILRVLAEGPDTLSGIARALGGLSKNAVRQALARMFESGRVRQDGHMWSIRPEGREVGR